MPVDQSFATEDPEVGRQFLVDSYGDHRMRFAADPDEFRLCLDRRDLEAFQIDEFDLRGATNFDFSSTDRLFVSRIRHGSLRVTRHRGDDVLLSAGDVAVTGAPDTSSGSAVDHVHAQILILKTGALAAAAAPDPGIDPAPVALFDLHPISPARARFWAQTLDSVCKLFDRADLRAARLIVGRTERLLAAATLSTFRHDGVAEARDGGNRDAHPETLRLAISFIETSPDADIAIADVARAAHVTPRSVQHAFRRHLGTTPMAYLRRVRLDQSHQQLRAAVPGDGTTVARIALDWGFANPSRYARYYRDAYGRTPSVTLAE